MFSYYKKLSASQKRVYDQSAAIKSVTLPLAEKFGPLVQALEKVLKNEDQDLVSQVTLKLAQAICKVFKVSLVRVNVLAKRPSHDWGELHGLYQPDDLLITVWMRTAKRKEVVSFKTFLRTVVHEVMHHLDYTHFKLANSMHTEGFYSRESSLFKQLLAQSSTSSKRT